VVAHNTKTSVITSANLADPLILLISAQHAQEANQLTVSVAQVATSSTKILSAATPAHLAAKLAPTATAAVDARLVLSNSLPKILHPQPARKCNVFQLAPLAPCPLSSSSIFRIRNCSPKLNLARSSMFLTSLLQKPPALHQLSLLVYSKNLFIALFHGQLITRVSQPILINW